MAKKTTRRSASLKGTTYYRLRKYCGENGLSVSGYLETLIAKDMEAKGIPELTPEEVQEMKVYKTEKTLTTDEIASQHFTF